MTSVKLYRHALSGHSHRVELFLSILGLKTDIIDVALNKGAHKQPEYVAKNIFGQVPVIEIKDEETDITLADSNAILTYLATQYDASRSWLPTNALAAAEVQRFLSLAAGKIAHGPAVARLITVFGAAYDAQTSIKNSHATLSILEAHLANREWLATDKPTIADIANYTYIAHAPEGNVSLHGYPNIRHWLKRIERLPGFIPMRASAVGLNT